MIKTYKFHYLRTSMLQKPLVASKSMWNAPWNNRNYTTARFELSHESKFFWAKFSLYSQNTCEQERFWPQCTVLQYSQNPRCCSRHYRTQIQPCPGVSLNFYQSVFRFAFTGKNPTWERRGNSYNWAAACQNQQKCTQRRLGSACASAQPDQSSLRAQSVA